MHIPTASCTNSPALTERPRLDFSSSSPFHRPSQARSYALKTHDVQVHYLTVIETPNDKLSIEFDPVAGEATKLQVRIDKVKEWPEWMEAQGCEDKFGLDELVEMASRSSKWVSPSYDRRWC